MFRANFCPSSGAQDWGFSQHVVLCPVVVVGRGSERGNVALCVRYEGSCFSLALLKMGKSLPGTCWTDHWRSIKLLLLHLVGFYITLPTWIRIFNNFHKGTGILDQASNNNLSWKTLQCCRSLYMLKRYTIRNILVRMG